MCLDAAGAYASVSFFNPFPVGSYTILTQDSLSGVYFDQCWKLKSGKKIIGVASVLILAPEDLYRPFLYYEGKANKLFYPLCKKCADMQRNSPCRHGAK